MSTYWYFQCLDHSPPLTSDEFTQHSDDEDYGRGINLAAARPLDHAWWDGPQGTYSERNARSFLEAHPTCRLEAVSEYGEQRPIDGPEPSVQPPTREQIAEPTADELFDLALNGGGTRGDALVRIYRRGVEDALALFPQPTPSAEPCTCPPPATHLGEGPDQDCPKHGDRFHVAEPVSIADMAPGTTFNCPERWTVGPPNLQGRQWAFRSGEGRYLDEFDAFTIRDVAPPPATPEEAL